MLSKSCKFGTLGSNVMLRNRPDSRLERGKRHHSEGDHGIY